ncbi:MAG: TonB-dependent receptor [Deltaproteobacteria bacterium]|nr:TonB-dependent receptor [Deltaproteobacteria bacterium]
MSRAPVASLLLVAGLAGAAAADDAPPVGLSDDDLQMLAEGEAIEIFDERPDKPFDRDTSVRLTGEQLAARGAVDLGSALAMLPDVTVRDAGRGGRQFDIRGARKGEVTILIDGVAVSDPYYGTFDPTTIPITDIVQIRVSTTPQSPIDGPGGSGGVIEVHTRDAIGPQVVVGRLLGDSLPSFGMTGTARVALAKHLALRVSSSNLIGGREHELPMNASIGEGRRAATGAARLEYRRGDRRAILDGFLDDRHYISPPSDTVASAPIVMIDRETQARASVKIDDKVGKLQLQGQGSVHALRRRSRYFLDPALLDQTRLEDITGTRYAGMGLATRPFARDFRWVVSGSLSHETVEVIDTAKVSRGELSLAELASGLQYERKRWRLDAAGGVAVPIGVGADPWPEAKVVLKYQPLRHLELTTTGGYKGRLPSLRERFDAEMGDPALASERVAHAEVRATEHVDERLHLELAPFYRHTSGTIRQSMGRFVNTGELDIYGIDVLARGRVHSRLEVGTGYQYIRASSALSNEPLDFLPHHKVDGWAQVTLPGATSALVRVKYVGSVIDGGEQLAGYTLVEANATAKLGAAYLLVLRVEDALDTRPEVRDGFRSTGRVVTLIVQGTWE